MNAKVKPFDSVVIVGFGNIGWRVAAIWQEKGLNVSGVARSAESQQAMLQCHIQPIKADLARPQTLQAIPVKDSVVYYFAPPQRQGKTDLHIANFLASISDNGLPARIVAISTSGVYGDCKGALVNEDSPVNPQVDRAHRRLDMEQQLRVWGIQHHVAVVILRVGGIYSCERLPLQRIKKGIPLLREELAPKTNRIHADDLAQACVAAATKGKADNIYNVSDGQESNMTEYFITLADFFNLPRPPLVDWDEANEKISEGMLSYLRESRRMDNTKMLNELGIKLKYPDLISGLQDCKN